MSRIAFGTKYAGKKQAALMRAPEERRLAGIVPPCSASAGYTISVDSDDGRAVLDLDLTWCLALRLVRSERGNALQACVVQAVDRGWHPLIEARPYRLSPIQCPICKRRVTAAQLGGRHDA